MGAAGTRHSPRPLSGEGFMHSSGALRREDAELCVKLAVRKFGPLQFIEYERAPRGECEASLCSLTQYDPRRRVVAGAFLGSHLAVDACLDQARRKCGAQQQMIEPQSGIARPAVSLVIPERVHRP